MTEWSARFRNLYLAHDITVWIQSLSAQGSSPHIFWALGCSSPTLRLKGAPLSLGIAVGWVPVHILTQLLLWHLGKDR